MEHLFMVRHGACNLGGNLTVGGKREVRKLAEQMAGICSELRNGSNLLSSDSPRAIQTAGIIAEAFGLDHLIINEKLFSKSEGPLTPEELEAVDWVIRPYFKRHDAIAVVSHWDIVYYYSRHFWKKELEGYEREIRDPEKGEAAHFDLKKRRYQMLPKE